MNRLNIDDSVDLSTAQKYDGFYRFLHNFQKIWNKLSTNKKYIFNILVEIYKKFIYNWVRVLFYTFIF